MKYVKFFFKVVWNGLLCVLALTLLTVFVQHIGEWYFNKNEMEPLALKLVADLNSRMPDPPTTAYFKQYEETLKKSRVLQPDDDLIIYYTAGNGSSLYSLDVDVWRQKSFISTHGDSQIFSNSRKAISGEYRIAYRYGRNILKEHDGSASPTPVIKPEISTTLPSETPSSTQAELTVPMVTESTEYSGTKFDFYLVVVNQKPIAYFDDEKNLDQFKADLKDYEVSGFDKKDYTIQEFEEVMPAADFELSIDNHYFGSFYTLKDAKDYGAQYKNAFITNPRVIIWDNIPVKWYAEDQFMSSFNSITDGAKQAVDTAKSKLVSIDSGRVVWDNYPKECGTCDSPIQDQY